MTNPNGQLAALLAAVAAEPDDDGLRLVLADWLEEHGEPERAELIRVQTEMARETYLIANRAHWDTLAKRCDRVLKLHEKAWVGDKPRGWSVQFQRGLLRVQVNGRGIYRLTDSDWWEKHSAWVMSLRIVKCRDEMLGFAARHAAHVPELDLNCPLVTAGGLRALVGWGTLRELWLWTGPVRDEHLRVLVPLGGLRGLDVRPTQPTDVTDEGVRALGALRELRRLRLTETATTGAGFDALRGLHLQTLNTDESPVTDSALRHLAGKTGLRELSLYGTRVTDAGLKVIAGLTGLEELVLSETAVTDAGLRRLTGLKRLRELAVGCRGVTDAGLKHLARLPNLRDLSLLGARLTGSGLGVLAEMKQLRALFLPESRRLPRAALDRLQAALPECRIY
jgi:uncharacterized protein (TIGR02996 family)